MQGGGVGAVGCTARLGVSAVRDQLLHHAHMALQAGPVQRRAPHASLQRPAYAGHQRQAGPPLNILCCEEGLEGQGAHGRAHCQPRAHASESKRAVCDRCRITSPSVGGAGNEVLGGRARTKSRELMRAPRFSSSSSSSEWPLRAAMWISCAPAKSSEACLTKTKERWSCERSTAPEQGGQQAAGPLCMQAGQCWRRSGAGRAPRSGRWYGCAAARGACRGRAARPAHLPRLPSTRLTESSASTALQGRRYRL